MSALDGYLDQVRGRPFAWGVHDCLIFTNTAWQLLHGYGWADDWLGRYLIDGKPLGADAMRREFGFSSFADAMCVRMRKCHGMPPRFALVASSHTAGWGVGVSLGVCLGARSAFVGVRGLVFVPSEKVAGAWVK